jgi:hypothetical protein
VLIATILIAVVASILFTSFYSDRENDAGNSAGASASVSSGNTSSQNNTAPIALPDATATQIVELQKQIANLQKQLPSSGTLTAVVGAGNSGTGTGNGNNQISVNVPVTINNGDSLLGKKDNGEMSVEIDGSVLKKTARNAEDEEKILQLRENIEEQERILRQEELWLSQAIRNAMNNTENPGVNALRRKEIKEMEIGLQKRREIISKLKAELRKVSP